MTTFNLYENFETEKDLETDGFWYNFSDETSFRLARAGGSNMKFTKAVERITRPYRRQIENESISVEMANSLTIQAFAEAVVLGWKGVVDRDSNELPFTKENVVKLLTDLPDLFNELRNEATRQSNFRVTEIEEDLGN